MNGRNQHVSPATPDTPGPSRLAGAAQWDGRDLGEVLAAGTRWLARHVAAINALNVFPVPDGDTGTNMVLTLQAALHEVHSAPTHLASGVAAAACHGALMGARGNSGVIMSQVLRGLAGGLASHPDFTPIELAGALDEAARVAYKAVLTPVEGTLLTVVRATAAAAVAAARQRADFQYVLEQALAEAEAAVQRTPEQLAILREAGVVDAGGYGFARFLEGWVRLLRGEALDLPEVAAFHGPALIDGPTDLEFGYCTNFVIQGVDLDFDTVRDRLATMGESAAIAGDETLIKVHLHTHQPGTALSYAVRVGRLCQIKIESMQEQHEEVRRTWPAGSTLLTVGVVAVAAGAGLSRVLRGMGAGIVVPGGQSMNPSTEELLQAVEALPQARVLILPNHRNVTMAARQAAQLTAKSVSVVETRTVPEGVAALSAYDFEATLEYNLRAMAEAAQEVHTAELTVAVRDVQVDGLAVRAGECVVLIDGQLAASGKDPDALLLEALVQMHAQERELITIYHGASIPVATANDLATLVADRHPGQRVEVVDGGQPSYDYIISCE